MMRPSLGWLDGELKSGLLEGMMSGVLEFAMACRYRLYFINTFVDSVLRQIA
jgi:hypothetical protein